MRRRWACVVLLLVLLPPTASGDDCMRDEDVLANLFATSARKVANEQERIRVKLEYKVDEWSFESRRNRLNIDGVLVLTWTNTTTDFSHLNPCSKVIALRTSQFWRPPIAFVNSTGLSLHENTATVRLSRDGTVQFSERVQQLAPCQISSESLPFGNATCSVVFENREPTRISYEWDSNGSGETLAYPSSAGSLSLRDVTSSSSSDDSEKKPTLTFTFSQNVQSLLIRFFLPSLLFLIPPWLTLLLGPMAITRCCILMTSLILLSIHYHSNLLDLPHSNGGVDAIAVWKLFSFFFVILLVVELVVITLLASIGRSRSCCYPKSRSAKYEMEPLYEEMNDLRQRKTRKTRSCCRMTALSVDIASFVLFGVVLLLFCYGFYTERSSMVRMINEFEMESLYIL